MKSQKQDIYHGIALAQMVHHGPFQGLKRNENRGVGHLIVNGDRYVLVKYRTGGQPWQFTFKPDHLDWLDKDAEAGRRGFVVLVCDDETICGLSLEQTSGVIDFTSNTQQTIRVEHPDNGSMRVTGSTGKLSRTVPHNAFPDLIFD